jgi:hypothetical protein
VDQEVLCLEVLEEAEVEQVVLVHLLVLLLVVIVQVLLDHVFQHYLYLRKVIQY